MFLGDCNWVNGGIPSPESMQVILYTSCWCWGSCWGSGVQVLKEVGNWMWVNKLIFNLDKTEFFWSGRSMILILDYQSVLNRVAGSQGRGNPGLTAAVRLSGGGNSWRGCIHPVDLHSPSIHIAATMAILKLFRLGHSDPCLDDIRTWLLQCTQCRAALED